MVLEQSPEFVAGLCRHFGLPLDQVRGKVYMTVESETPLTVTFSLSLTPADLSAIGGRDGVE